MYVEAVLRESSREWALKCLQPLGYRAHNINFDLWKYFYEFILFLLKTTII